MKSASGGSGEVWSGVLTEGPEALLARLNRTYDRDVKIRTPSEGEQQWPRHG